jgi:hypothetical protein
VIRSQGMGEEGRRPVSKSSLRIGIVYKIRTLNKVKDKSGGSVFRIDACLPSQTSVIYRLLFFALCLRIYRPPSPSLTRCLSIYLSICLSIYLLSFADFDYIGVLCAFGVPKLNRPHSTSHSIFTLFSCCFMRPAMVGDRFTLAGPTANVTCSRIYQATLLNAVH